MSRYLVPSQLNATPDSPEISIIVPVYNAAAFLVESIRSVLVQTMPDWELVCIDDGSADGSLAVLQEFARQDSRVKVIHQANAGVSAARNRGIEASRGTWLMMLDSDDCMEPRMLEEFLEATRQAADIDLVCCGYDERLENQVQAERRGALLSGRQDKGCLPFALAAEYLHASCWAKLYRRELILNHHLQFDRKLKVGEDHLFVLQYLMHARTTFILPLTLYHYIIRGAGAISRFEAGKLPPVTYVSAITLYADLARTTPRGWGSGKRKAFCTALLAHFLRMYAWGLHIFRRTGCDSSAALRRKVLPSLISLLWRSGLIGSARMLRRHMRR